MPLDPLLGLTINDQYLIIKQLGSGGMGCVYQAENLKLDGRPCAIKVLKENQIDSEYGAVRFQEELKVTSQLRSPHIVQVLDKGELNDGRLYIVMELLEGEALSSILEREGALDVKRSIQIIQGVLAGLSEAHALGIIHRDLKPANIFITRSVVGYEIAKVLDFGIAKNTHEYSSVLTHTQQILGTPQYMSPEQLQKEQLDQRTDLYAVGLLLYELLSGQPPYQAKSSLIPDNLSSMPPEVKVMWLQMNAKPEPLEIPDVLWGICERLLEKHPNDRLPSATKTIQALAKVIELIDTIEYTKRIQVQKNVFTSLKNESSTDLADELPEYELKTINEVGDSDKSAISEDDDSPLPLNQQARLVVTIGPRRGHEYQLDRREVTIGRSYEYSDIIIQHPTISSAHVQFKRRDEQFIVTDLGSSNGLHVNDVNLLTKALHGGDVITLGKVELLYLEYGDSRPYVSQAITPPVFAEDQMRFETTSPPQSNSEAVYVPQPTNPDIDFNIYAPREERNKSKSQRWLIVITLVFLAIGVKAVIDLQVDLISEGSELEGSAQVKVISPTLTRSEKKSNNAQYTRRQNVTLNASQRPKTPTLKDEAYDFGIPLRAPQTPKVNRDSRAKERAQAASLKSLHPKSNRAPEPRQSQPRPPKRAKARYVGLKIATKGLFFSPGSRILFHPSIKPKSLRSQLKYIIKPRRAGYMRGNRLSLAQRLDVDQVKVRVCVHSVCSRNVLIRIANDDAPE